MTRYAKDHDKVGATEFSATVWGDGPDGSSVDIASARDFSTREQAQEWVAGQFRTTDAAGADIYEMAWEEYIYFAQGIGRIYDADARDVSTQYGWPTADRTPEWDGVYPA